MLTIVDIAHPQDRPRAPMRGYVRMTAEQAAADYAADFGAPPEVVYRHMTMTGRVTVYIPLPPGIATAGVAEVWHG